MLMLLLAVQLLLLAQASFAETSHASLLPTNLSDALLHRWKRSAFVTSPNCPEPIYLTQSLVSAWPGITVDTTQTTILDDKSGLNLFKCSEDTFFVYTHLPTVLTRADWWLACGTTLSNGWRVRDAGSKNTAYGNIPVGCVKPTCTGLQIFEGNEFVLASYPTYQIVPNRPTHIGINQKFQFTCPVGSTIGFAASAATITLDASIKITCENEGWWMKTSSNLAGQLLSAKVACFKQIPAPPAQLPAQCQTGINYYTDDKPIWGDGSFYTVTSDRAVIANGQWALVCPSDTFLGYSVTDTKLMLDSMKITCETTGWQIKTVSNGIGKLLSSVKVGCFRKQPIACTGLQLFDGSESIIAANAAAYQLIHTVPSNVGGKLEFVCPSDALVGYTQGDKKLSVEPLKITCESAGWWVKSPNRVDGPLSVKVGCFKELPTGLLPAPASTDPKPACGCWYEPSACSSCDRQKLFVLEGQGAMSGKCTLGCANGYIFEGGEMNMISCQGGYWFGSSRSVTNVTVPLNGPFGYITTSCVPAPTPGKCPLSYDTFECEGCDATKIIGLSSPKSGLGCVLACDKDYRLLILDGGVTVIRAQEAVAETGYLTVYRLGDVKTPIRVEWATGQKYSCEPVTADTNVPVKLIFTTSTKCNGIGIPLFDGSEAVISANVAAYQFIRSVPSNVGGKLEFVCPTDTFVGYAQSDKRLSIEPLKITCESTGWWVQSPNRIAGNEQYFRVNGTLSVKVGCFKEVPTGLAPAPVSTAPRQHCGCWYERSTCSACDSEKLFILDGQGASSGRCTLGCAKGYVFEGGDMNMLSCNAGYWIGSSRSVTNVTIPLSSPFGYILTSCVPAPTTGKCSIQYSTFECVGCDATKLIGLPSPKSSLACVLACDKDYRLLILDGAVTVIRAQEAVIENGFLTVYRLGDVKTPIRVNTATGLKYSCEPVTADINVPVKLTPVTPTVPPPPVETCGCAYTADVSNPAYDSTKLFTMDSSTNRCTLQCDAGYRLAGGMSSVACKDGKSWYYQKAENGKHPSYDYTEAKFSCEIAPATCGRPYNIAPCRSGKECNPAAITTIKGAKSICTLSCARGYQLAEYRKDGAIPYTLLQEAFFYAEAYSGAGGWIGIPLGETMNSINYNQPSVITVNCERYVSPSEQSRIPPNSEKRLCGCPYDFSGCPTCQYKPLFRLDGFGDFSDRCILGCSKGYMFEGGQVNTLTCKKGQGWFGSPRTVNGAPLSLGSGDKITTSCVPIPAPATCSLQYATFECENKGGNTGCYSQYLVALSSPKSSCVLACDIGYRLLVTDASRKVTRAQEAVLEQGSFKVYPLGEMHNTISIPSNVIRFSCEAALLTMAPVLTPL